jgi:chemotaxis protein histidine kinase CheA
MSKVTIDELVTKYLFEVDPKGFKDYQAYLKDSGVSAKRAAKEIEDAQIRAVRTQEKVAERATIAAERAAERRARAEEQAAARAARAVTQEAAKAQRAREQADRAAERSMDRLFQAAIREAEKAEKAQTAAAERAARAQARAAEKAAREQVKAAKDVERAATRAAKESAREADKAAKSSTDWGASLQNIAAGAIGLEAVLGVAQRVAQAIWDMGAAVVNTGVEFEGLRARLKTVTGSGEAAGLAFAEIQDFAATTPFQLQETTDAFIRLKNLGLDASRGSLTAFGNVAAASGKDILQFIEAVADASTGEFERLKEFGIKAKTEGEKITFTFRGQRTTVKKDANEIAGYLKNLGETAFAGAIENQAATTAGAISNLKDTVSQFLDRIASLGVLDVFNEIVKSLTSTIGGSDGLAHVIADFLLIGLEAFRDIIADLPGGEITEFLGSLVSLFRVLVGAVMDSGGGFADLIGVALSFLKVIIDVAAAVGGFIAKLQELSDKLPDAPGLLDLLGVALKVTLFLFEGMATVITKVIDLLTPLLDGVTGLIDKLPSLGDVVQSMTGWSMDWFGANENLNASLANTASVAQNAAAELEKLRNAQKIENKTDAELVALRQAGGEQGRAAEAEIRKRVNRRTQDEKSEASAGKRAAAREKALSAALGDEAGEAHRIDKTDRKVLEAIAADATVSEKQRDKAQKELDKRDKKDEKKPKAKKEKLTGLEKQVDEQIRELSGNAELRVSAQALREGKAPAEAFELGKAAAKQTEDRIRQRFNDTGELPMGIARDIDQLAHSPAVEESIGRVPPPVISVVNHETNVTVSGNTFTTDVNANLAQGVTVRELTQETAAATMRMVKTELGTAVSNILPKVRV